MVGKSVIYTGAMDDLNSRLVATDMAYSVAEPGESSSTEQTMVDVLNIPDGMASNGSYSGVGRDLTVILELDRMQLGKVVYRLNNEETQRVGVNLAGGFA